MNNNLYWNVYKSLERELLALAEIIHIDDGQLDVYSMKIADLLIRTSVEIESISKELYFREGGTKPDDKDLYFDTDCLALLESKWSLSKKVVMISSPIFYLKEDDNIYLTPLHKAYKRGSSSSDWQKAYQAVKHNRAKSINKGNIKHFIRSLAALYLLNVYYNDYVSYLGKDSKGISFDANLGSSIFSVDIHPFQGLESDGTYCKLYDYDRYTYLVQPTIETKPILEEVLNKVRIEILEPAKTQTKEVVMNDVTQIIDLPQEDINAKIKDTFTNVKRRMYSQLSVEDRIKYKQASDSVKYEMVLNINQY